MRTRDDTYCCSHGAVRRLRSSHPSHGNDAPAAFAELGRGRQGHGYNARSNRGAALIIVLAFVVLLTGLGVAYFSRTTPDRQISMASFNNTAADVLARSALDIVVSDVKKEVTTDINNGPPTSANIGPVRDSDVSAAPNLIRRSLRSNAASFASAINSTTDASANNRLTS